MKHIKFLSLILALIFLQGCTLNSSRYVHFEKSPSKNYYSNKIKDNLIDNKTYSLQVFDTNLYKYFPVDEKDNDILKNFINTLDESAFLDKFEIKNKEIFRLIIKFPEENYIIKIYDNKIATLNPWDGHYSEDIIDMSNLPLHFNLYDFCNYIKNKK
ncbi:DUF4883 family protein [Eubacterium multiforme]|uniref:Lipoprotein n=1 Tax=Eubacterium multiforme TaxID=83339 RepID=A0ABT9UPA6_9FIRM|nr:DUF4883 family protein [Eubacterium multiforme]MDQ0148463.1 hypothetical protein [Eubacterium multiforme]